MIDYTKSGISGDIHQVYMNESTPDVRSMSSLRYNRERPFSFYRFSTHRTLDFYNHYFGTESIRKESIRKKKRLKYSMDYRSKHLNYVEDDCVDAIFRRIKQMVRNRYEY